MATTTVAAAAVIENDIVVVVAANRKRIIIPTGERRRERGDLLLIYAEEEMRQVNPSSSQAGYTHTITSERKREIERERSLYLLECYYCKHKKKRRRRKMHLSLRCFKQNKKKGTSFPLRGLYTLSSGSSSSSSSLATLCLAEILSSVSSLDGWWRCNKTAIMSWTPLTDPSSVL